MFVRNATQRGSKTDPKAGAVFRGTAGCGPGVGDEGNGKMGKLIWKLRYALHMRRRVRGMPWREAWYLAGSYTDDFPAEDDPIEQAEIEISYMAEG